MAERNYLLLKAQLQSGKRRADGSVTIPCVTAEEIDTAKFAEIDYYRSQNGWFAFFPNEAEVDLTQIPKENANVEGGKTPSQRLRSVLYVLYTQTKTTKTFPQFYDENMEKFIDLIKTKLE
jgi:hypothetical protein